METIKSMVTKHQVSLKLFNSAWICSVNIQQIEASVVFSEKFKKNKAWELLTVITLSINIRLFIQL